MPPQRAWWGAVMAAVIVAVVAAVALRPTVGSAQQGAATANCPVTEAPNGVEVCVDRGDNAVYRVGEPITICATVTIFRIQVTPPPPPLTLRVTNSVNGGAETVIFQEQIRESTQRCITTLISPPTGTETIRATVIEQDGTIFATDSVSFRSEPAVPGGTPTPPAGAAPTPPSNLTARVLDGNTILLNWTDNATTETGFRIYQGSQRLREVGPNITGLFVDGLTPNTTYCFRVAAFNNVGESPATAPFCLVTVPGVPPPPPPPPPVTLLPATPVNLIATALDPFRIQLVWTDTSNVEAGFRIYQDGAVVATAGPNATSLVLGNLRPTTQFCFRVSAFNNAGESDGSNVACAFTPAPVTTPPPPSLAAPTNLQATALDANRIRLTWTDTTANEEGFRLFRDVALVGTVGANSTSFEVGNLPATTRFCFTVAAFAGAAASAPSNEACATTAAARTFSSATLFLGEPRPCIPEAGASACDAFRQALWNGDAAAWATRGVTDPDARFNETVVFRVVAGDPVAIANIARILQQPFVQVTAADFGGIDEFVEVTNLGGAAQSLAGWTLRSPRSGLVARFTGGVTLGPGESCRVYTTSAGPNACADTTLTSVNVWPDEAGTIILYADPIDLPTDEVQYNADPGSQPPAPNLQGNP